MRFWTPARFWAKVIIINDVDSCWNWTGAKYKCGYGHSIRPDDAYKTTSAHRVAWMITNGEIPQGRCVLHRCDNKTCVRPSHLFLGTKKDNTQDAISKGRFFPLGKPYQPPKPKIKKLPQTPFKCARAECSNWFTKKQWNQKYCCPKCESIDWLNKNCLNGKRGSRNTISIENAAELKSLFTGKTGELAQLAKRYGVSYSVARNIISGKCKKYKNFS